MKLRTSLAAAGATAALCTTGAVLLPAMASAFAGASGTIRAKAVNHAPTKHVVTITYSG